MQTTFDGPFGFAAEAGRTPVDDGPLVVMRTEDGGLEILGESLSVLLSLDDLRTLLFFGSTVELENAHGIAAVSIDPRRSTVVLVLDGREYRAPRWAITAVARGRLAAAYFQPRLRTRHPAARGPPSLSTSKWPLAEARE